MFRSRQLAYAPHSAQTAANWWTKPLGQAVVCGILGTLVVSATAPVWHFASPNWRLTLPLIPHPGGAVFSATAFVVGVVLLGYAWYRFGTYASDLAVPERTRVRVTAQVIALWSLPIMLGPPLLSNDVYSYAAQGELTSRGLDPTRVGPWALGGGPFWRAADSVWHYNPSPYGHVWDSMGSLVVRVTGHDASQAVWGFRVLIAGFVVLAGWAVLRLARQRGVNPALALALAIGNPLILIHGLGGIHNDVVMTALLLVGLALMGERRRGSALVVLSLAVAVKLPAIVGLGYLGWTWSERPRATLVRAVHAGAATIAGAVLVGVISVQTSMSHGWLTALSGTGSIRSTFAPSTMSGFVVSGLLNELSCDVDEDLVIGVCRGMGLLAAAALGWFLLTRSSRIGVEMAIGSTILFAMVLSPVLWPWYLIPAIGVLAVTGLERFRPAVSVWCVALAMLVFPVSVGGGVTFGGFRALLGFAMFGAIGAVSIFAQWLGGQKMLPSRLDLRATKEPVQPAGVPKAISAR